MPTSPTPIDHTEVIATAFATAMQVFDVSRAAVFGRQRVGPAWQARAAIALVLFDRGGLVWREVAEVFGARATSSTRDMATRMRKLILDDAELAAKVGEVRKAVVEVQERQERAA